MAKKNDKSGTEQFVRDSILFYYSEKKTNEACNSSFEQVKIDFKNVMERYFDKFKNDDGKIELDVTGEQYSDITKIILSRVQPTKVTWNIQKLNELLDKKQKQLVIQKNYQVNDWPGFLNFLKDSGLKFSDIKKFISIEDSVRVNQLDKLIDLGLVDEEEVKKCSDIKLSPAYYTIKEK